MDAQLDEAYERWMWGAGRKKDALDSTILEDQPKHTSYNSSEDTSKTDHGADRSTVASERFNYNMCNTSYHPVKAQAQLEVAVEGNN